MITHLQQTLHRATNTHPGQLSSSRSSLCILLIDSPDSPQTKSHRRSVYPKDVSERLHSAFPIKQLASLSLVLLDASPSSSPSSSPSPPETSEEPHVWPVLTELPGCLEPSSQGVYALEIDRNEFLVVRGNKPWVCTPNRCAAFPFLSPAGFALTTTLTFRGELKEASHLRDPS